MSKSAARLGFGGVIRNPILDILRLKHSLGFQLKILEKKIYESAVSNKCLNFGYIVIIFSLLLFLK